LKSANEAKKNLSKAALSGLLWQYSEAITQALLQLIVFSILARLLSPQAFGQMGVTLIFIGFASLFSQLGVGPALVQMREVTTRHIRAGFTLSMLLSLVMTLGFWGLAQPIASFFRDPNVEPLIRAVSVSFFILGFGAVAESLLQKDLKFRTIMMINNGSYFVGYGLVGVVLAFLGFGVWSLVLAHLSQSAFKSFAFMLARPHAKVPIVAREETRELLRFGVGMTLVKCLNYAANQGDYFVVGRFLGTTALGLYTRAFNIMLLPVKFLGQTLSKVLFPSFSKISTDLSRMASAYLSAVAVLSLIMLPVSAVFVLAAREIILILLGQKWLDTIVPLQLLSLGILIRTSYKVDDSVAKALGAVYRRSLRDGIYAVLVVVGALIGLRYGITGVAVGSTLAAFVNYLLGVRMSLSLLQIPWSRFLRSIVPGLLLGLITALALTLLTLLIGELYLPLRLFLLLLVGGGVPLGLVLAHPAFIGQYGLSAVKRITTNLPKRLLKQKGVTWLIHRFEVG
jgi:O-antigen/teichoic acid export membrane protein